MAFMKTVCFPVLTGKACFCDSSQWSVHLITANSHVSLLPIFPHFILHNINTSAYENLKNIDTCFLNVNLLCDNV